MALNKKRVSLMKEKGNIKADIHSRNELKKRKKGHDRSASSNNSRKHSGTGDTSSEQPSYVVEKIEEGSPPPRKSPYSHNRGKSY
ncbi:hypothetical protein COOONC_08331 [Cooperia oncophora]